MKRKSSAPEVATPRSAYSTSFCTAMTSTCITMPRPVPRSSMAVDTNAIGVSGRRRESRNSATDITAVPAMGKAV